MQRSVGTLAALVVFTFAMPAMAQPELALTPESVSITVPVGGRVAVVGVMRRLVGVVPGFERWDGVVKDDDGDGLVEVGLEAAADPEWSQWIAVDLGTGEWAAAGRSAFVEPAELLLPVGAEVLSGSALWLAPAGIVEVLVVRPGSDESAGAWGGEVWDGGSSDGDGLADGVAGVAPGGLRPVGDSGPAPESYAAGDVLIAITPRALRYGVTRVVAGTAGVAQ